MGQGEDTVNGIPELGHGTGQKRTLLGRATGGSESGLEAHGIVEVSADTLELRRPRGQRVGFIAADHVAHGHSKQIEIILDAEQLQRVLAIPVDQFRLQLAEAGNLPGDVRRVCQHSRKGDNQPQNEANGRRTVRRRRAGHAPSIQRRDGACHRADGPQQGRMCVTMLL